MDKNIKKIAQNILYSDNPLKTFDYFENDINDELLHLLALNYNWDDGFELPFKIINHKMCDLGTALLLFYLGEGQLFLEDKEKVIQSNNKNWINFLEDLYDKILANNFKSKNMPFSPPINKVQIYKLKKANNNIPNIFFDCINGITINNFEI